MPRWSRTARVSATNARSSYAAGSSEPPGPAVARRVDRDHAVVLGEVGDLALPRAAVHARVDRDEDDGVLARVVERLVAEPHAVDARRGPAGPVPEPACHHLPLARLQRPCNDQCNRPASASAQRSATSIHPGCPDSGRPEMTTIERTRTEAPAIDMDTLMAFVGKFVGDLGATIGAGNVLLGERLGLYRALAAAARRRALGRRGHRHRPAVRRRVAARPGRGRLHPVRRRERDVLDDARAGVRADRPDRPGVPARRLRARPRRPQGAAPHRGVVPHRRRLRLGRSTTRTCSPAASGSSARGT